ncbi:MAG: HI1506-related protein [Methylotenera sp.]|nr:HI1506-related protein [Methylotenera sp.]
MSSTNENKGADAAATKKQDDAKTAPKAQAKKVKALQVVSAREGFRRGGHVFGRDAVVLKIEDLTKEQIKQIKDERLLAVSEVEIEVAAE